MADRPPLFPPFQGGGKKDSKDAGSHFFLPSKEGEKKIPKMQAPTFSSLPRKGKKDSKDAGSHFFFPSKDDNFFFLVVVMFHEICEEMNKQH